MLETGEKAYLSVLIEKKKKGLCLQFYTVWISEIFSKWSWSDPHENFSSGGFTDINKKNKKKKQHGRHYKSKGNINNNYKADTKWETRFKTRVGNPWPLGHIWPTKNFSPAHKLNCNSTKLSYSTICFFPFQKYFILSKQ